jgi:pilus assembly protein Flp/PilA
LVLIGIKCAPIWTKIARIEITTVKELFTTQTYWGDKPGVTMRKIIQFLTDESGATAIEYGLIAAGISVAIIATVNSLGTQLNTTFSSISTQLK